jgi:hypothetical protein
MQQALRPSDLVPRGFIVDEAVNGDRGMLITVRPRAKASTCPGCGMVAERIHSRYFRRLADLPWGASQFGSWCWRAGSFVLRCCVGGASSPSGLIRAC